jgi:hypothetical protein
MENNLLIVEFPLPPSNIGICMKYFLVLSREWMGMGDARIIIDSWPVDHSPKFPTFSTCKNWLVVYLPL